MTIVGFSVFNRKIPAAEESEKVSTKLSENEEAVIVKLVVSRRFKMFSNKLNCQLMMAPASSNELYSAVCRFSTTAESERLFFLKHIPCTQAETEQENIDNDGNSTYILL